MRSEHTQTQNGQKEFWDISTLVCNIAPWWAGFVCVTHVEDSQEQTCEKGEGVSEHAFVTFGNTVILIPHLGLSIGLQQDYTSRPIITWQSEGEVQCQNSHQQL